MVATICLVCTRARESKLLLQVRYTQQNTNAENNFRGSKTVFGAGTINAGRTASLDDICLQSSCAERVSQISPVTEHRLHWR